MSDENLASLAAAHGTPLYIYDKAWLKTRAKTLLDLCERRDVLARYAIKANPHLQIITLFAALGLEFDASSEFEAEQLISAGVAANKISLSSQQPPKDMAKILKSGVQFVATSLHQLELVELAGWRGEVGVRINPGLGSGHNRRTTTGGAAASFGVWHEYLDKVIDWQQKSGCKISRLHIHTGSGGDENSWRQVVRTVLEFAERLEHLSSLDMGGGFKVARMPGEQEADLKAILGVYTEELESFNARTNRKIRLEIEPGSWLVAGGGYLVSKIIDIVDTGRGGYTFLKLDSGMNDLLRPALYGAQHPIKVLNNANTQKDYVVVGHNCESGDILTPTPGNPELIAPRALNEASIGDLIVIGCVGAYGASMRAVGYNSYPSAGEILT